MTIKKFILFLFLPSTCFGAGTVSINNSGSGGGTVSIIGASSGGGSGTVTSVNSGNGITVTNPAGPSVVVALSSTPILSQNTLQPGSTFYVSSGTVEGNFYNLNLTSGNCVQAGIGGLLTTTSLPCGSGSGSPSIYVASVTGISPIVANTIGTSGSTVTISMTNNLPGGSTSYLASGPLPGGSTSYIQNTNILQAGSTFYVASGTVQGIFTVIQPDNDTSDGPISLKTLTTQESAPNMYHSLFLYGIVPNPAVNGGEFVVTMSSIQLTSSIGSFADKFDRPEIAMATAGNPGTIKPYIALRSIGHQFPNGSPDGDFVVMGSSNISFSPLQLDYASASQSVCTDSNKILTTSGCSTGGGTPSLYVASVTANSPLIASTAGTAGSTVTISMSNNLPGGATSYLASTILYVASVTTNASLISSFSGTSGATVTLSVNVSSISLPNSGVTAGSYTSANVTVDSHGLVTAAANGSGGAGSISTITASTNINISGSTGPVVVVSVSSAPTFSGTVTANGGVSASTITVSSLTVTGQILGTFYERLFPTGQLKLGPFGEAAPYISNSTSELTAAAYFDDTSTQAVSWTFRVHNYDGRPLTADIVSHSTGTSNFTCWEVYTSTNLVSSGLATQSEDLTTQFNVGVTTAVRINSNQLAPIMASVLLSNTVVSNGDMLTIKLERQTGGCGNTEAVGFARMTEVDVHE